MGQEKIFSELRRKTDLAESVFLEAGKDSRRAEIVVDIAESVAEQLEQVTDPVEAQKLATRLSIRGVLEILIGAAVFKLSDDFFRGAEGGLQDVKDAVLWMLMTIMSSFPVIDGLACFPQAKRAKILSADIRDVLRQESKTGSGTDIDS